MNFRPMIPKISLRHCIHIVIIRMWLGCNMLHRHKIQIKPFSSKYDHDNRMILVGHRLWHDILSLSLRSDYAIAAPRHKTQSILHLFLKDAIRKSTTNILPTFTGYSRIFFLSHRYIVAPSSWFLSTHQHPNHTALWTFICGKNRSYVIFGVTRRLLRLRDLRKLVSAMRIKLAPILCTSFSNIV